MLQVRQGAGEECLMSKELFMAEHERLVAEYIERHDCDWTTAYEATADRAYDAMRDALADRVAHCRQLRKDGMI